MTTDLDSRAIEILRGNDLGGYTVPTAGLYPHQWNWDSAFVALGFATFDRDRAWREIERLFEGQWADGMVPHIVFRRPDPRYFPGPEVWGTGASPPTSGHSQPPVVASVLRHLVGGALTAEDASRLRALYPKLLAWHRWYHRARDPDGRGVIAVMHPWESGRDNSPDWDRAMGAIDTSGVEPYERRDTNHVAAEMRPRKADYDRYMTIVQFGRDHGWDEAAIARDGPFWVADPGITMILLRADRDLKALAGMLDERADLAEIDVWIDRAEAGVETLWDDALGAYSALDLRGGARADGVTSASMLSVFAGVGGTAQADRQLAHLKRFWGKAPFGVPSFDPEHPAFDALRYWRGPVWAMMNFMIAQGLAEQGHGDLAARLRGDTRQLIETAGFHENFCPLTGRGGGGGEFSWTAAIWLAWASPSAELMAA